MSNKQSEVEVEEEVEVMTLYIAEFYLSSNLH